jgi:hypothetical protein
MPTPPLSPKPQRWQSRSDEPHPDIQALLSTFDTSSTDDGKSVAGQSEPGPDRYLNTGTSGHIRARTAPEIEIRTTSPSPRKGGASASSRSSQRSLSPLDLPSRNNLFNDTPQNVAGQSGLSRTLGRGGSVLGPRTNPYCKSAHRLATKLTIQRPIQMLFHLPLPGNHHESYPKVPVNRQTL